MAMKKKADEQKRNEGGRQTTNMLTTQSLFTCMQNNRLAAQQLKLGMPVLLCPTAPLGRL